MGDNTGKNVKISNKRLFRGCFQIAAEYFLVEMFLPLLLRRRDGRAVECGGLENR